MKKGTTRKFLRINVMGCAYFDKHCTKCSKRKICKRLAHHKERQYYKPRIDDA